MAGRPGGGLASAGVKLTQFITDMLATARVCNQLSCGVGGVAGRVLINSGSKKKKRKGKRKISKKWKGKNWRLHNRTCSYFNLQIMT